MNFLKSLAAVSSMTMFSRVLGFARDAIVARIFGAGMATDAFFVAFKLPNLLRRIFAEGAFSQAFVPILAEYKSKQGEDATRVFVSYVSGLLTLALAIVTVIGMLAAPWVITITAPGFADTADKFALTTQLLRITFPYILLISLASLVGAILNTWNRFSVPAFAPTFLNVSMIGFALFAAPYFHPPVLALAWAVTVGGVLQLAYQLPHLKKIGMLVLPRINLKDAGAMRVVKQMGPAILGVSVSQISLIINTIFASFLVSGDSTSDAIVSYLAAREDIFFSFSVVKFAPEIARRVNPRSPVQDMSVTRKIVKYFLKSPSLTEFSPQTCSPRPRLS